MTAMSKNHAAPGADEPGLGDEPDEFAGPLIPEPPHPINWNLLTGDEAETQWLELNQWVNWLRHTYGLPASVVPPFWHRHPELVWELSALHLHWLAAFDSEQNASAPLGWHRDFADARQRLRDGSPPAEPGSTETDPPDRPSGPARTPPNPSRTGPSPTATRTSCSSYSRTSPPAVAPRRSSTPVSTRAPRTSRERRRRGLDVTTHGQPGGGCLPESVRIDLVEMAIRRTGAAIPPARRDRQVPSRRRRCLADGSGARPWPGRVKLSSRLSPSPSRRSE